MVDAGVYMFNIFSFSLALSALGSIIISLYLYQYKDSPGTIFLALMQFATAIWAVFYCLEYSATSLHVKLFWSKFSYFGILFTPVFFYFFSLRFVFREKPIPRMLKTGLISGSLLLIGLVMTNDYHHLHWKAAAINPLNNTTVYRYGPVFWFVFLSIYVLLLLSIANIMKLITQVPKPMHVSVLLMVVACVIPVTGNIIYVFKISPAVPGFDWTPICFFFSGIILSYINIRFNTFDLIPFAREKLFDFLDDGIMVTDRGNRVADINKSILALTDKTRGDFIGKELAGIFPERKELIEEIIANDKPMQVEVNSPSGNEQRFLEIRTSPLFDKNGDFYGRIYVFSNITERRKYEETIVNTNRNLKKEIAEREKLIDDLNAFAHTVAHDLRDSISAIVSSTDLIQLDIELGDLEAALEANQIIFSSASKTLYIIKELLTLATVREEDVYREKVEMGKVIAESENRLREIILQSRATIIKPDKWPVIKANPAWLEEVWINFIGNALKYGGSPPVIELGAEQLYAENKVKFWIKDNGLGLTAREQEKLFRQFARLDPVRAQGTGLGLSIVKRIIEKLGGNVGVFSNAIPGKGSVFYFILPVN